MESLIKIDKEALEPLSKVLIALMDKMEKAACWVAMPKGKSANRERAISFYIKELEEKEDMPPLMKAALITQARKTLKEYCNITDIVHLAIRQLNEDAKPQDIDDDWFSYFYEHAKNINLSEAKILWAKILANECNRRSSIPKLLIHILSVMSLRDAKAFECLCGFITQDVNSKESAVNLVLIHDFNDDMVINNGLNYELLRDLEALGLICQEDDLVCCDENYSNILKLRYQDMNVLIYAPDEKEPSFPFGNVMLTNAGLTLSTLIEGKKLEGFLDYLKLYFENLNFTVEIS
ncbi:DUF2806 domain-containing protein [Lacrimispora sp.]|uniref:DUF2806 domain-containing protein n=1 Tax=Lacrimispora sp. TaxID=2719234 RepID=UPI0028B22511|nr:DUF2806 domain-containing protein [Lacrimispora sp.]